MGPNPQVTVDLVTFTEEILYKKLHFLCSVCKTTVFRQLALSTRESYKKGKKGGDRVSF